MPITALPTPPSRDDPTNFAEEADAFLGALPAFATEANALQADVNSKQSQAAASQAAAAASEAGAAASSGVTVWVSGTTYAVGNNRFDPTDFLTYRRKTAGAGTTRPALDPTNWQLLIGQGNVTLSATQTFTGNNTFSGNVVFNNAISAINAFPVGGICPFPVDTVPAGFLKCNGQTVSRTTYAALYAFIGTLYGVGDGSTTFHLPNYTAMFLRGLDEGRGIDPGRTIGTSQASANLAHAHSLDAAGSHAHSVQYGSSSNTGSTYPSRLSEGGISNVDTAAAGNHTHTMNNVGGSESRPWNYSVIYCIKF